MMIPPLADRFLTPLLLYQTIKILFVNIKNMILKIIFFIRLIAR
jgi:hypothetical protein